MSNIYLRPKNHQELFNLQHAQAHNVIECIFGVVKRHFDLLCAAPEYSEELQAIFVSSMGALHNFIQILDPSNRAEEIQHAGRVRSSHNSNTTQEPEHPCELEISQEELGFQITDAERKWAVERHDQIAKKMWEDYQAIIRL